MKILHLVGWLACTGTCSIISLGTVYQVLLPYRHFPWFPRSRVPTRCEFFSVAGSFQPTTLTLTHFDWVCLIQTGQQRSHRAIVYPLGLHCLRLALFFPLS